MKRFIILIFIICLILCGCQKQEAATTPTSPSTEPQATLEQDTVTEPQTEPAPLPSPVYAQQPMVAISMPLSTEAVTSNDNLIYYYTYQNIYLTLQDQQVADHIIVDYLNRIDRNHSVSQDLAEQAQSIYTGDSNWEPHFFESFYSPTRIDSSVLSLFGRNTIYIGGTHPNKECLAANYSTITGEVLTLGSILQDESSIAPLCELVIENMSTLQQEYNLYDDYPQIVQSRFAREASYDEDWYFSEKGLCFFFAPYEVAPYISGIITAEIPYNQLTNIIDDAFFPPESDYAEGSIFIEPLESINIENYTQLAELTVADDGSVAFLYTDGLVRNVQIDAYTHNEDTGELLYKTTVFAEHTLSPGDGIIIQMPTIDTPSILMISYTSGDGCIMQFAIRQNDDDSFTLVDAQT